MTASPTLHLLCAGAAQGLVKAVQPALAAHGALSAQYGAVGVLREALLSGAPCDVMITTQAMLSDLAGSGALRAAGAASLGRVATGVAVCRGVAHPALATRDDLRRVLQGATALYFPDAQRATAGIHFSKALAELGLAQTLAPRLHQFPNGATAMREMALAGAPGAVGCTQVSEILYTDGVELVAALPPGFELVTEYSAAVGGNSQNVALAERFINLLRSPNAASLRRDAGFED